MDATTDDKRIDLLTDNWYQTCEERRLPTDRYHRLGGSLRQFLPPGSLAGLGFTDSDDDAPFIIALTETALIRFSATDAEWTLDAKAFPLTSIAALWVRGSETSSVRSSHRVGHWEVALVTSDNLSVRTLAPVRSGWGTDYGGELVMLTLGEQLGWPTPLKEQVTS